MTHFRDSSRIETIAHLRELLRSLTEKYATVTRDDIRTELIWIGVEQYTRELDALVSAAQSAQRVAENGERRALADRDDAKNTIAELNRELAELRKLNAQGVPQCLASHRNVGTQNVKQIVVRWELCDIGYFVDIAQYTDDSGWRVTVFTHDDDSYCDEPTREIRFIWDYLHKPGIGEITARLTDDAHRVLIEEIVEYDD